LPLLPAPRLASPRLEDVSPDPIPDRQLEYFLRLASARRSRADTIGLADSSPDARLSNESLAMLYEEEDGEPVEHLLGAVPEPTLPVDTAPVSMAPESMSGLERPPMPLRAPAHLTPLPGILDAHSGVQLDTPLPESVGSAFDEHRPLLLRPKLRDISDDSGEQTALASSTPVSGTMGALPPPRAFSKSETPAELSTLMRRRRRQRLAWTIAAGAATLIAAIVAYGIFSG